MSFKDLEAEIRAWANLEAYAKEAKEQAQEAKRQAKRDKRAKKEKTKGLLSPKPRIDLSSIQRAPRHFKRVTIEAREIHHRTWGEQVELSYEVETISDAVAECAAIEKARKDGYSFDAVVSIVSFTK